MPRPERTLSIAAIFLTLVTVVTVVRDASANDPLDGLVGEITAMYRPGDLVILTGPDTRFDIDRFGALPVVATERAPIELDRFDRVFLVHHTAAGNTRSPAPRSALLNRGRAIWTAGDEGWSAELFQMERPARAVGDLMAELPAASVRIEWDDGRVEPCPWDGSRHQCPSAEWLYVGPISESFAGQTQRCVWSHPVDGGTLVVEFPRVRGATDIDGWYGLTDYAVSIHDGARASITLRAGDARRGFHAHRRPGRIPLGWELPANWDGPLRIEITAIRAGVRHLCWNLQTVRREGGSP